MSENFEGGCACGNLRYQLVSTPMFVNCCHCRDCQRQTRSALVINAVIETDRITLLQASQSRYRFLPKAAAGATSRDAHSAVPRSGAPTAAGLGSVSFVLALWTIPLRCRQSRTSSRGLNCLGSTCRS